MLQSAPFIRLSLLDSSGSAAGVNAWMRAGATVSDGESAAAELLPVVGALSGATVVSWHVVFRGAEVPRPTALGATAAASAGVFVFSCSAPDTYAVVVVPGLRSNLLVTAGAGAGILIDQANADVIALADALIAAGCCNPFGVELVALEAAYRQWRP